MSRRTTPFFDVSRNYPSEFNFCRMKSKEQPSVQIFDALDHARFDLVRRIVASDPNCLFATKSVNSHIPPQSILDYALNNCRTWNALLEHCRRTGIALPHAEDLTFPRRLSSMKSIVVWLLLQPNVSLPKQTPLHTAVVCELTEAFEILLKRAPHLAASVDTRGRTPLHTVCAFAVYTSCDQVIRYISQLHAAGADFNACDRDGKTPLRSLLSALNESEPVYGLVRRRRSGNNLSSMVPVLDELLACGADIYHNDAKGSTAIELALISGLDYIVLAQRANLLRDRICRSPSARNYASAAAHVSGNMACLSDDLLFKIFTYLSPKQVITGVGVTCVGLRRIAVSDELWRHLETARCLALLRSSLRRNLANSNSGPTQP
ncbi:hypothetical protein BWQ96_06423 [Gracilariopsis chorda]|uniref:F-box domain-containing protein n=1 Tax=Gracilariopsis chorda TaxID=448386 RepID=A0A2V3IP02_9FLOR|nr:hypothetical protein BWQ96_06423 [Gracilariopsis chorda]|eukprot:PXF43802.1 hypothetical protein BWQ96_06423 [Gracilariopsis chorda]